MNKYYRTFQYSLLVIMYVCPLYSMRQFMEHQVLESSETYSETHVELKRRGSEAVVLPGAVEETLELAIETPVSVRKKHDFKAAAELKQQEEFLLSCTNLPVPVLKIVKEYACSPFDFISLLGNKQVFETNMRKIGFVKVLRNGHIATAGLDSAEIQIWNTQAKFPENAHSKKISDFATSIYGLEVLQNDHLLVFGSDLRARIWDPVSAKCLYSFNGPEIKQKTDAISSKGFISCIAILPDGNIALGNKFGTIEIFELQHYHKIMELSHVECVGSEIDEVLYVKDAQGGAYIAACSRKGAIFIWHYKNGQIHRILKSQDRDSFYNLKALPGGLLMTEKGFTPHDKCFFVWDVASGKPHNLKASKPIKEKLAAGASKMLILPNNQIVMASLNILEIWDETMTECLQLFKHHDWGECSTIIKPDEFTLIQAREKSLYVYKITPQILKQLSTLSYEQLVVLEYMTGLYSQLLQTARARDKKVLVELHTDWNDFLAELPEAIQELISHHWDWAYDKALETASKDDCCCVVQ